MRSREFEEAVRPQRMVMTIVWGALLASVGIYVLVVYVATPSVEEAAGVPDGFALALTVAALGAAAAALVMPSRLLSDARLRAHMEDQDFDPERYFKNPHTGQVNQAQLERVQKLSEVDQRLATGTALYFTPWIVGAALAESVAVFGLVLAFTTGEPSAMIPFAVGAAALLALKRPRFDTLLLRLERMAR